MNQVKLFFTKLWKDESGQGTAEYILVLAALVGIAVLFKKKINEWFTTASGKVEGGLNDF